MDAGNALPIEWRRLEGMMESWRQSVGDNASRSTLVVAAASICGDPAARAGLAGRWLWPLVDGSRSVEDGPARAWRAFRVFVFIVARASLAAAAVLLILRLSRSADLPDRTNRAGDCRRDYGDGGGRGIAVALFSPRDPQRRLAPLDDRPAEFLFSILAWGTVTLALTIVLQAVHKAAFAPLIITVATNALFAAVTAGLLAGMAARFGQLKRQTAVNSLAAQWLHPLALVMAGLISAALVAGFASFAAFLALRVIVAAVVFAALYLLLELAKAVFAGLGRPDAAPAGVRGASWRHRAGARADRRGAVRCRTAAARRARGYRHHRPLGNLDRGPVRHDPERPVRIQDRGHPPLARDSRQRACRPCDPDPADARGAALAGKRSPAANPIEPSLQQSIATIFGYIGIIAAIALALGNLGIDLQKIALVAGALSVGIGFGLQSIVSNFVSGLILLAERPIRVGDSIVVKGEEGWVRRVRVRATEIETYDRASVIIPNSELITGVVKNWTRANTLGRIVIKVGAPYSSDPEKIRDLLNGIAKAHPQIVQSPAPGAFLLGFGQSALEFELRCIVADVEKALSVKSDLHFAIIKAFRAEGIGMGPDPLSVEALRRQLFGDPDAQPPVQGIRRAV